MFAAREWQVRRTLPLVDGEVSHGFGFLSAKEKREGRNLGGTSESFRKRKRLAVKVFAVLTPSFRRDNN